jgi:hypothetical protein
LEFHRNYSKRAGLGKSHLLSQQHKKQKKVHELEATLGKRQQDPVSKTNIKGMHNQSGSGVGWLRQRDGATEVSGSEFIKQASRFTSKG